MVRHVLVSGGAGYIGSHVCKELARNGFVPITLDNMSTGFRENVKWGPLIEVDLRDKESLISSVRGKSFFGAIHLAASAYVEESQMNPVKYFDNNLISTINFISLINQLGIKNLVFSSSCAVYGSSSGIPFVENVELNPINNYGLTKKMCEQIIMKSEVKSPWNFAILRYFNACGADLDGELAENHLPETHLIPILVEAALKDKVFEIFGDNYDTPDGTAIRDYVHVSDLAKAHVDALKRISITEKSIVLNLGSGKGISINQWVESIVAMGFPIRFRVSHKRPGDAASLVADTTRARQEIDWYPEHSEPSTIIKSVILSRNLNQNLE